MEPTPEYDDRYLAGILFFNAGDFFEAHEVWEDLWHVSTAPERRFYQGLIQTAVALFHRGNRNYRGATRLYHSSRDYLAPSRPKFLGLNLEVLWEQMHHCFAPLLAEPPLPPGESLDEVNLPQLQLEPPPQKWPDPETFLPPEDEEANRE